jgi:hypothetical protein
LFIDNRKRVFPIAAKERKRERKRLLAVPIYFVVCSADPGKPRLYAGDSRLGDIILPVSQARLC